MYYNYAYLEKHGKNKKKIKIFLNNIQIDNKINNKIKLFLSIKPRLLYNRNIL